MILDSKDLKDTKDTKSIPEFVLLFNYKKEVGENILGHYFGNSQTDNPIYSIKNELVPIENIITFSVCDQYVFMSNTDITHILISYIASYKLYNKNLEKKNNTELN